MRFGGFGGGLFRLVVGGVCGVDYKVWHYNAQGIGFAGFYCFWGLSDKKDRCAGVQEKLD